METAKTVEEWGAELGEQMRALRLRANLDQVSLAKRAGISLTAIKNLESGKGATLKTLIKALRVLDRADWLSTLAPPVSISPLQMLKAKPARQRARRRPQDDGMDRGDT
ncbi:MAG: helix-turn-helix domain-containing protein [Candidatus Nitricoxidivorans perseverans]|uniref:Helix-turn-helix domain-containing protein n=1 Tax=Candidatus Nitricoxidivorans perseverans TaxID=2975601 RepID=A0AA49IY74_9PROT|nr:MAG: helix-turn-helix domain-containing protein [Candidatus Nitricoxidivorans perseverans]